MKYDVSKELFEAVRKDINGVISIDCSGQEIENHFRVNYKNNFGLFHYDEFFVKCKKWALEQGYLLDSNFEGVCEVYNYNIRKIEKPKLADSEQQSVFDACMYILEQLKENNDCCI